MHEVAPQINTVTLTDLESNANRYTSSVFPYELDMSEAGEPAPTYAVKAKLTGATFNFGVESDTITAVTSTAGTQTYKTDTIASVDVLNAWNQSQDWSSLTNFDAAKIPSANLARIFDGDVTKSCQAIEGQSDTITWASGVIGGAGDVIRVYFRGNLTSVAINGTTRTITQNAWNTVTEDYLTSLEVLHPSAGNVSNPSAIEVNGKILVDTGITGDPGLGDLLTFPTDNNFDKFEVGDVVQSTPGTNQSQEWSDGAFNLRSNNGNLAFDGNLATYTQVDPDLSSGGFNFPSGLTGNLKVYCSTGDNQDNNQASATFTLSNGAAQTTTIGYQTGPVILDFGSVSNITSVTCTWVYSPGLFNAFMLDGVLLVDTSFGGSTSITAIDAAGPTITTDGGSWYGADGTGTAGDGRYEPSQQWSSLVTPAPRSADPASNAFDGTTIGPGCIPIYPTDGGTGKATFSVPSITSGVVVITGENGGTVPVSLTINGVAQSTTTGVFTFTETISSSLVIEWFSVDAFNYCRVDSISVGGKLLVDSSVPGGPGETTVDKNILYAGQLTVASDSDLAEITGGVYMTDGTFKTDGSGEFEPADYTLQTSEIASVDDSGFTSVTTEAAWTGFAGPQWSPSQTWSTLTVGIIGNSTGEISKSATTEDISSPVTFTNTMYGSQGNGANGWAIKFPSVVTCSFAPTRDNTTITAVPDVSTPFSSGTTATYTGSPVVLTGQVFWYNFPENYPPLKAMGTTAAGPITLTFNTPNPDLQYFQVGDVVQSDWNQSQEWSDNVVTTGEFAPNNPVTNMFDGDLSTYESFFAGNPGFGAQNTWTGTGFGANVPVTVYIRACNGGGGNTTSSDVYLEINGSRYTVPSSTSGFQAEVGGTTNASGELNLFWRGATNTGGSDGWNYLNIGGVEVNSKLLVNSSIPTSSNPNGFKIVSTDTTANTMTVDGGEWAASDTVSYGPVTGTGTIVDKTTSSPWEVSLNPVSGRWIGPNKAGTNFKFAPVIPVSDTATTVYCKMQVIDDKAEVMGIQTTDPGFLNVTKQNYDIQFPALFTDGDAPDTALPPGTELTAIVKAENNKGDSVRESNTVMPLTPNPADSAGPITNTNSGTATPSSAWNQSQVWSNGVYNTTGSFATTAGSITNVFDGDLATALYINANPGGYAEFTFTSPWTGSYDWQIVSATGGSNETGGPDQSRVDLLDVNDNVLGYVSATNSSPNIYSAGTLTGVAKIRWEDETQKGVAVYGVYVNGQLLVNTGISGGPTTGLYDQDLTLGNAANLGTFVANDALKMVDDTGAVASYVPVTSTIASVSTLVYSSGSSTGSLNITGGSTGSWSAVFDGSLSTYAETSSSATLTLSSSVAFTKLEIYVNGPVVINDYGSAFTGNNEWVDASIVGTPFSKISLDAFGIIKAVRVDGSVLLDNSSLLAFDTPNLDLKFFNPGDVLGPETGFKPVLYSGTGATHEIKTGFSPDLVWIKVRDAGSSHRLFDTVRGATKHLASDTTDAEDTALASLIDFTSNGFTLGQNNNGQTNVNLLGNNYVAWCWDAGDTTVANNDGTIESQVRSNGNFSVVSYTGNSTQGASIGCGLSNGPNLIIVKNLDTSGQDWPVYHSSLGNTQRLYLDLNVAKSTGNNWNNTTPTNVISLGQNPDTNENNSRMIAYCWQETPGVSSFGEYNGGTINQVIDCGFKPAFVMIRKINTTQNWLMIDSARGGTQKLNANLSTVENDSAEGGDASKNTLTFESNGFKLTTTDPGSNQSGGEYIYAAFAGAGSEGTVVSTDLTANTMTVNGGNWNNWNQSQVWSNQVSIGSGTGTIKPDTVGYGFDGNSTTFTLGTDNGSEPRWTPTTPIASGSIISVILNTGGDGNAFGIVKDSTGTLAQSTMTGTTATLTFTAPRDIDYLQFALSDNGYGSFALIEINGVVFVDPGAIGSPPTVATGPKKSGTGTFVSTNGTDSMTITNSNLDWISNDNRLSQDFYVQPLVTRLNSNNPAHVALQQAIVTAFSTVKTNSSPALTGDLYRLLAGETLTAAEIATLTDRLTAATHGDRPFHLDGYYPLYYTAVGANAASPTSSNHTHVLGGNTYYMPDGVTIYHGTYVPTVDTYTVLPHISTNPTTTTTTTTTTTSSSSSSSGGGSPSGGGGY